VTMSKISFLGFRFFGPEKKQKHVQKQNSHHTKKMNRGEAQTFPDFCLRGRVSVEGNLATFSKSNRLILRYL